MIDKPQIALVLPFLCSGREGNLNVNLVVRGGHAESVIIKLLAVSGDYHVIRADCLAVVIHKCKFSKGILICFCIIVKCKFYCIIDGHNLPTYKKELIIMGHFSHFLPFCGREENEFLFVIALYGNLISDKKIKLSGV